nr:MAG TPA: hypothetical protein [Caudoviricetes sp.]
MFQPSPQGWVFSFPTSPSQFLRPNICQQSRYFIIWHTIPL